MENYVNAYSLKQRKYVNFDRSNSDGLRYISAALGEIFDRNAREQAERLRLEEESKRRLEELQRKLDEARRRAEVEERIRLEAERMKQNPYYILGLTSPSSVSAVHKAYRLLASKYHPDRFLDPRQKVIAGEKMKEINKARDSLLSVLN